MRRIALILALLLCTVSIAAAQTEGKVSIGGTVTWVNPSSDGLDSLVGFGPLVRLNPKRGWGIAAGLSWFRTDVDNPSGESGDFARMRIRPLMAGIAYTIGPPKVLTSFSIVAGPSFNSFEFRDSFLNSLPPGSVTPDIDIKTSFAVRPGVGVTFTVAPRVGIIGFGGYAFNRPDVVYTDRFGTEFRDNWKADAFLLSTGVVFSLF
jgi:hypothetical protein